MVNLNKPVTGKTGLVLPGQLTLRLSVQLWKQVSQNQNFLWKVFDLTDFFGLGKDKAFIFFALSVFNFVDRPPSVKKSVSKICFLTQQMRIFARIFFATNIFYWANYPNKKDKEVLFWKMSGVRSSCIMRSVKQLLQPFLSHFYKTVRWDFLELSPRKRIWIPGFKSQWLFLHK